MLSLKSVIKVDVLCLGYACYDLVFSVPHHPHSDEKIVATDFVDCGGGPAANAAVMVAKLGLKSAFSGYLGDDLQGESHYQEFLRYQINTDFIQRGSTPTPMASILVKPNGDRALINYKGITQPLTAESIDFSTLNPKVILLDGHQPHLSLALLKQKETKQIPTILDAGSIHEGSLALMGKVDYLICSEKFALQHSQTLDSALENLANLAPVVVITLGEKGLLWRRGLESGTLAAYPVNAVDSTGAGDAFHGAFATALALNKDWLECLRYASAAGALCATKTGARLGLATQDEHRRFLFENTI
ncbi:MAG: PfkB family carbohydrate kinase [Methylococcales bacterium]|nr:PfkB family carbohydrate kinase [Methylococcales bacterium]